MNDTPDPRRHESDDELGDALGDALHGADDDLVIPPPVTSIAERAAARAKARNARRTVGSIAASVVLVAGGLVAWNAAGDGGEVEQAITADRSDDEPAALAEEPAPAGATSELAEIEPVEPVDLDPAEISTGPVLEWVEVAGPGAGSAGLTASGDGTVIARLWDREGGESVLASTDGVTWEPVVGPPGVSPAQVELGEDLWVVTGWVESDVDFTEAVHVSDDGGASWRQLEVPGVGEVADGYLVTRSFVSGAVPLGDAVVVAAASWTDIDVPRVAVDQGIAASEDEVVGWRTGGGRLTIEIGDLAAVPPPPEPDDEFPEAPFPIETFEFTTEELGLPADLDAIHETGRQTFTLSVVGPEGVRATQEFPGNPSRLANVDDTLVLSTFGRDGSSVVLTSTDGVDWVETEAGEGFELAGAVDGVLWGTDWSRPGFGVQRLTAGGLEQVAAFPEVSPNSIMAAGPAGLAVTVDLIGSGDDVVVESEEEPLDIGPPPGVLASKDGIELRFEADGSGALVDTESGEVLRSFTAEEVLGDEPPAGVIELEGPFSLRIEDPETGEELVTFAEEDYVAEIFESEGAARNEVVTEGGVAFYEEGDESFADDGFVGYRPPETWVGWSRDGVAWGFESLTDAFAVPEGHDAWAQVVVGDGFVLAVVEHYPVAATAVDAEAIEIPPDAPTTRWFLAQVD